MANQVENNISSKEGHSVDTNFEFVAIDRKVKEEPMSGDEEAETCESSPFLSAAEGEPKEIKVESSDALSEVAFLSEVSMSPCTNGGHFMDPILFKEENSGTCAEEETHCIGEEFCKAEISQGADDFKGTKVEDLMPAKCEGSSSSGLKIKSQIGDRSRRYQSFASPIHVRKIISAAFSCSECALRFETKLRLKKHLGVRHGKPFLCIHCPAAFAKSGELTMHMPSHTAERVYSCLDCCRTFKSRESLTEHLTSHAKKREEKCAQSSAALPSSSLFSCPHCNLKFATEGSVIQHAATHLDERLYSCIICESKFKRQSQLVHHMAKHSDGMFACANCPSKFKDEKSRAAHSCSKEKVYSCTLCPAQFKFRASLYTHLAAHAEERPFSCVVCSAEFKTMDSLRKHTAAIHGSSDEKTFSCAHCTATFKCKGDLMRHATLHADQKQFTCWYCPAAFTHKSSLNVHMVAHSNKKRFSCVQCDTTFKTKSCLVEHLSVCPK